MNPSNADTRLAHLSALLLETYQLAREEPIERFHDTVLDCLTAGLPFEKAWWGRAALTPEGPFEQSSHLYGLPRDYLDDWLAIRAEDITVQRSHAHPGHAVVIDTQAPDTPQGLRLLGEKHGFGEFLCIVHIDPITQLSDHLSLYRPPGAPPFEPDACRLLECVMPHLAAAVAKPLQHFQAIQLGQAQIHRNDVKRLAARRMQRFPTVGTAQDLEPACDEAAAERAREVEIVFDEQEFHWVDGAMQCDDRAFGSALRRGARA